MNRFTGWLLLLASGLTFGQALDLGRLEKLKAKASETVNITLDGSLLQLASRFLSNDDPDEAQVKKLVAGVKRIVVRSFEFTHTGEYLDSDVDAIRSQLHDPNWKKVVEFRSKADGESADIYLRYDADHITGATLISAEPKELTIVHVEGPIDVDGLAKLAGNFGIPDSVRKKVERKSK